MQTLITYLVYSICFTYLGLGVVIAVLSLMSQDEPIEGFMHGLGRMLGALRTVVFWLSIEIEMRNEQV